MIVKNIGAILIWSENWRTLADWYRDILELEIDSELDLPDDTGVNFMVNDTYFWVGAHDGVHGNNKDKYRIMVGFDVDSVKETFEKLSAKGVKFIKEPGKSPDESFYVATAEDPEENIIQFYSNEL